jgi:Skp family chaperone for outer membrane proteins
MNKFLFGAAAAALAFAIPAAAPAQQLPAGVVGVVDSQRILEGCTVCVAANQQLEAQQQQLRQRAQQLGLVSAAPNTPSTLEAEAQAIQAAVNALPQGQQPDAALQARFQTYQTNLQNAQREIGTREQQIRRNQGYVLQQIQQRVAPAVAQVAQQRGATVVLEAGNIAWNSPATDLTPAVVAVVNQNTTPLNVNAPPPQQQGAQQQQQPPQQQRREQGR